MGFEFSKFLEQQEYRPDPHNVLDTPLQKNKKTVTPDEYYELLGLLDALRSGDKKVADRAISDVLNKPISTKGDNDSNIAAADTTAWEPPTPKRTPSDVKYPGIGSFMQQMYASKKQI